MIRSLFFILILFALALGVFYFYQGGELPVIGESLGDVKISTSVKAALALHQDLSGRPVSVRTHDAVVTLSGRVGSDEEKAAAEEVAESVEGVRRVDNLIAVTPELGSQQTRSDRSLGQKLDDTALAAKVKGAFALHRDLRHLDIRVEAREGKVFLEGRVDTPAQAETARTRALTVEGVQDVENRLAVMGEAEAGGDLGHESRPSSPKTIISHPTASELMRVTTAWSSKARSPQEPRGSLPSFSRNVPPEGGKSATKSE